MKGKHAIGVALAAMIWLAPLGGASAKEAARIDASSNPRVERSFARMMRELSPAERQQLVAAIVQLNQREAYGDTGTARPDEAPSAARIKGQIAGMTAREIIDLANRTLSTKAELLLQ
ncbi:hypothetical protein [Dyella sp. C9]|uniref:hypothetical protein n=1 Tax=Dyella sp. C9 TaxID=2202154 RepID=UPI000DEF0755|nr:hypothetical protein [Dyella sp. C9]